VAECVVGTDEDLARDLIAAIHHLAGYTPHVVSDPRRRLLALQAALRVALRTS
jgi:hypothetical protein